MSGRAGPADVRTCRGRKAIRGPSLDVHVKFGAELLLLPGIVPALYTTF